MTDTLRRTARAVLAAQATGASAALDALAVVDRAAALWCGVVLARRLRERIAPVPSVFCGHDARWTDPTSETVRAAERTVAVALDAAERAAGGGAAADPAECAALAAQCEALAGDIGANADDEEYDRGCWLVGNVALLLDIARGARDPRGDALVEATLRFVPAPGEAPLPPPAADPGVQRRAIEARRARRDAALRLQLLDWLAPSM